MRIHDLIKHFAGFTSVPIDPDDVAQQVKNAGVRDSIYYIEVELEQRVLKGALHTYTVATGLYKEPEIRSDIYFASCLPRPWKRLVCCKELLHILDASISQTATQGDFDKLMSGLCVTDFLGVYDPQQVQVWGDRLMVYYAMAIVFPQKAREVMLMVNPPDAVPLATFAAKHLDIPEQVAALVLSDGWPIILNAINGPK